MTVLQTNVTKGYRLISLDKVTSHLANVTRVTGCYRLTNDGILTNATKITWSKVGK